MLTENCKMQAVDWGLQIISIPNPKNSTLPYYFPCYFPTIPHAPDNPTAPLFPTLPVLLILQVRPPKLLTPTPTL
jgi:hypothetical protein